MDGFQRDHEDQIKINIHISAEVAILYSNLADLHSIPVPSVHDSPNHSLHKGGNLEAYINIWPVTLKIIIVRNQINPLNLVVLQQSHG